MWSFRIDSVDIYFSCESQSKLDLMRRKEVETRLRSEIIFRAAEQVANKYKLCQTAAKATRQLHIASKNTQETINTAFVRIAAGSDVAALPIA